MDGESKLKMCADCGKHLVVNGIHMGIPFGRHEGKLFCAGCYDKIMTDEHHVQRIGEEVI